MFFSIVYSINSILIKASFGALMMKNIPTNLFLMIGIMFFVNLVYAQSDRLKGIILVDVIDLPSPIISGEILDLGTTEPELEKPVSKNNTNITEYSVDGRTYKVKVSPKVGLPYHLEDREGRGQIGNKENSIYQNIDTPNWLLLSW